MTIDEIAQLIPEHYDAIAELWDDELIDSSYGIAPLMKAIEMCGDIEIRRNALDIGCGAGGRMIRVLEDHSFQVTGLDWSKQMLKIAQERHPNGSWLQGNIVTWDTSELFDLIIAWDSVFHVSLKNQESVIAKMCRLLKPQGMLIFTIGDDVGEHVSEWHDRMFYYSSLGIERNIELLHNYHCQLRHLELDQYPLKHCIIIAKKTS